MKARAEPSLGWAGEAPAPTCVGLCPIRPIEGAVLDGLGDVFGLELVSGLQVGDGTGYFEDAVVCASAYALLEHRPFEKFFAIRREFTKHSHLPRRHLCVAVNP